MSRINKNCGKTLTTKTFLKVKNELFHIHFTKTFFDYANSYDRILLKGSILLLEMGFGKPTFSYSGLLIKPQKGTDRKLIDM